MNIEFSYEFQVLVIAFMFTVNTLMWMELRNNFYIWDRSTLTIMFFVTTVYFMHLVMSSQSDYPLQMVFSNFLMTGIFIAVTREPERRKIKETP